MKGKRASFTVGASCKLIIFYLLLHHLALGATLELLDISPSEGVTFYWLGYSGVMFQEG